jgi:hypothetical protein
MASTCSTLDEGAAGENNRSWSPNPSAVVLVEGLVAWNSLVVVRGAARVPRLRRIHGGKYQAADDPRERGQLPLIDSGERLERQPAKVEVLTPFHPVPGPFRFGCGEGFPLMRGKGIAMACGKGQIGLRISD